MLKIRINPLAYQDLQEIQSYIAMELDNPEAAKKTLLKIVECYERLGEFPKLGAPLSSKLEIQTDYRYLIAEGYIVFYKLEREYISVYRILNAKRDYLKVLLNQEEQD